MSQSSSCRDKIIKSLFTVVVDTAGIGADAPWNQVEALRNELDAYQPQLQERARLIVANKADLPQARENLVQLRRYASNLSPTAAVVSVSALHGDNIVSLVAAFAEFKTVS